MSKKILKDPILSIYHFLLKIKIKNKKENSQDFHPLANNRKKQKSNLQYILFITFAIFVISNNLFAKTIPPEEFGQKSILSKIIPPQQNDFIVGEELIEERGSAIINQTTNSDQLVYYPGFQGQGDPDITSGETIIQTTNDGTTLIARNVANTQLGNAINRNEITQYTILDGDTVSGIAHKFNVSVATILWSNNLTERSLLKPGMTLKILPTTGILHKVARGETIAAIAKKYKADAQKILDTNSLASANQIKIGQELIIPDGIRPASITNIVTKTTTAGKTTVSKTSLSPTNPNTGTKLLWPAGVRRISQYYGWRHTGVDIAGPIGTPIYAAEDGVVETAGWNSGGYGNYIIINHGGGLRTLYGHASKLFVGRGEKVTRGQVIMAMGSTGRSTGSHLHFEVRINGFKNPLSYIR